MAGYPMTYYYAHKETSTVFHTEGDISQEEVKQKDLVFVGASQNPNKRMAVTAFIKPTVFEDFGWSIKDLSQYPEPEEEKPE